MIYFSTLLKTNVNYKPASDRLFDALHSNDIQYDFLENTRDIWLRDFMPVQTRTGKYVSFRYEPSYLVDDPDLKTDFRQDINGQLSLKNIVYSDINFDGGNVIFSPSKEKVVISDRIFMENWEVSSAELVRKLERLLEAQVIIIPSLKSDITGHADGMVRFIDENTAIGNCSSYLFGVEKNIKMVLRNHGIEVIDFPYFNSPKDSAVGCYLNFLYTEQVLFLPVFGVDADQKAVKAAEQLFVKKVVPVNIGEIAVQGGCLNCISWET